MIERLLSVCNQRYQDTNSSDCCDDCTYKDYCPHDCEKCLAYIHTPNRAPAGAPNRKYDCGRMADFYVCKYSCRYTSEMIYALRRLKDLSNKTTIKVLSFGCGPCTDLLALEYLRTQREYDFTNLEYRGVDYSKDVWKNIHSDIKSLTTNDIKPKFYYQDICDFISEIGKGIWIPDLVTFQYFLSDLHKHSESQSVLNFILSFAEFANKYMPQNSYIVLNDANFGKDYGGGREYFDKLFSVLDNCTNIKGRFRNEHSRSIHYPRGYPYGDDSDGEFSCNDNIFDLSKWSKYSPFNTCASAQMLVKKEVRR
jgi:hypothetical protein